MNATSHQNVANLALDLINKQPFIPSQLLEVRNGATCMCTGAAILFAAHLAQRGERTVPEFFTQLSTESDDDFVEEKARTYCLDPSAVRAVIINTKAIQECDRPTAIGG